MNRHRSPPQKCDRLSRKVLEHDKFGATFAWQIGTGGSALPTRLGALCTVFLQVVLIAYTGYKVSILDAKKDVDILQAVKEDYFDNQYKFGAEQGLQVAIAVGNESNPGQVLDPAYG